MIKNFLITVIGCALTAPLNAQVNVTVASTPACAACAVQLAPVTQLFNTPSQAGFGPTLSIATAGTPPRYYVASSTFAGEVHQYDASGKFVKVIGHQGDGPGEFSSIPILAAGPGDSIHAIERGRYHVIAPDGSVKRSIVFAARARDFVVGPDGILFIGGPSADRNRPTALQTADASGNITGSFDVIPANGATGFVRWVALDAKNARWSSAAEHYDITQWNAQGLPVKHFTAANPDLANTALPTRVDIQHEKPPGQVAGITFRADGNLYVFMMVADAKWKPQLTQQIDFQKVWDTVIDVIDPASGRLIARTRFDHMVMPLHNGTAYSMIEDQDGDTRAQIYKLSLKK